MFIQSCYPYAGIERLTTQQEQFVTHFLKGLTPSQSARAAGYKNPREASYRLLKSESIKKLLEFVRGEELETIKVDRDQLTVLLFEAHRKSATATEEISAIRELGKMHGLYEPEQVQSQNLHLHYETMDDEELQRIVGQ